MNNFVDKVLSKPLFKEVIVLFAVGYVLNNYAYNHHLYLQSIGGEFDSIMHFLGGLSVSVSVSWLYFFSGIFNSKNRSYVDFFKMGLVALVFIGFSWEIYELIAGTMSVAQSDYVYDTTLDIIFDTFGAIVGCIYAFHFEKQRIKNLILDYVS